MSRSGSYLDNAVSESFFASLRTELLYRVVLATETIARREITAWIDRYNRVRRHSYCCLHTPMTYEELTVPAAQPA